jgi:hypothetical protein
VVAKSCAIEVETLRGTTPVASSSNAHRKLVEAELEMVRAAWLPQHGRVVPRLRLLDRVDRV